MATWAKAGGLLGSGKAVLSCDGFYISYVANSGGGIFGGDTPSETALVRDLHFLILNGDHREAYERIAPNGYDACVAYYREMAPTHRSSWSEDDPAEAAA